MRIFYMNVSTIKTYRQTVIYRELSQHVLLKEKEKHSNISCCKELFVS